MISEVVAAFLWALVLAQLLRARNRKDHSVLYSALTIAVSLTLNIDGVYLAVDAAIGGRNVADLVANALLMTGLYFLFLAVIGAAWSAGARAVRTPLRWFLAVSLVIIAFAFFFIDAPTSSTSFMIDYGAQPAAAIYSIIQFLFIGVVTGTGAYVCAVYAWRMNRWSYRIGFSLVGIGCLFAVGLSTLVVLMDVAHVTGEDATLAELQTWYWPLYAPALIAMSIGAALPAVMGWISAKRTRHQLAQSLAPLEELWSEVQASDYELPATAPTSALDERVHRLHVEVRDALLRNPDKEAELRPDQRALLRRVDHTLRRP